MLVLGPTDPPEYPWLYAIPATVFTGGFLTAASTGMAGLVQAGYLTSTLLCIGESRSSSSPFCNVPTSHKQVHCLGSRLKQLLARAIHSAS